MAIAGRSVEDASRVEVWDLAAERKLGELLGHSGAVYGIAVSPDGKRIATSGRDALRSWDAETFTEIVQLRGHTTFLLVPGVQPRWHDARLRRGRPHHATLETRHITCYQAHIHVSGSSW